MPFATRSLVKEICRLSAVQGIEPPGATRLVKLLYLADLEWRRGHNGEPLTNLRWVFHHYGPYAHELKDVFGNEDAEEVELKSGRKTKIVKFASDDLNRREVPNEVSRMMSSIVERWAGMDLNMLLDYVYFETEPMEEAKRGHALDFSEVRPRPVPIAPTVDTAKLNALRSSLARTVRSLDITRKSVEIPLGLLQAEEFWKEDFEPPTLKENATFRQSMDDL